MFALANGELERSVGWILVRIIVAEMRAAALFALQRRTGDRLGNGQQIVQIQRCVPARIVLAISSYRYRFRPLAQFQNFIQSLFHLVMTADNSDQPLHEILQLVLHLISAFAVAPEGLERLARHLVHLLAVDRSSSMLRGEFDG